MLVGYARVSSTGQNLDSQIQALKKFGCTKIFMEKRSGKQYDTRVIYGIDKLRAIIKASHNRVSEKVLLVFALIGGTVGAIISMILFRHKIKKLSSVLKFIVLIVIQAILYYCYINKLWYNFEYINNIIG